MNSYTRLIPYARKIVDLVTALGCIRKEQLEVLFKDTEYHDDDSFTKLNKTLAFLKTNRFITYENDMVMTFPKSGDIDNEKLDCIWVAIDRCKRVNGAYCIDDIINAFDNKPVSIVMINSEDNIIYNIVPVTERNIASTMTFLVERFKSEHRGQDISKIKNIQYIFTVKDKALIPEIASYNPPMPNKIALLVTDENNVKNVKYLSKKQ